MTNPRGESISVQPSVDGSVERWFALRVKPRFEKVVATVAHNKGFEEFLPLHRTRKRWVNRSRWVDVPLFPGYVFCRLNPSRRLPLLITPGVLYMVGVGKIPAPIDSREIEGIQRLVQAGVVAEPWPFLEVGQRVRVEYGPLCGIEGVLIKVRKRHRIVLSITLLHRSVAMEIERDSVRPISTAITPLAEPAVFDVTPVECLP